MIFVFRFKVFMRVNQNVKAIFKLRGNRDRDELAHQPCAVQRSAFSRVVATRAKTWTLLCKIAPSKNNVALYGFFGQKEWNLWKFTVVCWLSMDRAPWVNERFMSGWKGLNWFEHVLPMKVVLVGHQHRATEKLLLHRNTETRWTI